jgi:20S proteasome alpha/beta subunit
VALRWGQGILVSADTRVSAGPYAFYEEQKLFPILFSSEGKQSDLAIVAGAGDAALVKQGSNLIKNEFREWYENRYQEVANPSVEEVEKMVKNIQVNIQLLRATEVRSRG